MPRKIFLVLNNDLSQTRDICAVIRNSKEKQNLFFKIADVYQTQILYCIVHFALHLILKPISFNRNQFVWILIITPANQGAVTFFSRLLRYFYTTISKVSHLVCFFFFYCNFELEKETNMLFSPFSAELNLVLQCISKFVYTIQSFREKCRGI